MDGNWSSMNPYRPPLIEAAAYGHAEIVRLLLDHGADPNISDGQALLSAKNMGHTNGVKLLEKARAKK